MKKQLAGLIIFALLFSLVLGSAVTGLAVDDGITDDGVQEIVLSPRYSDVPYAGRLFIPGVDIQVDCYRSNAQYVGDREDSANYFNAYPFSGIVLCDHNNQTFAPLHLTQPGDEAYILCGDGNIINMVCREAFYGRNTGYALTDSNGNAVPYYYDYVLYTCAPNGIYLCFWEVV